MKKLFRMLRIIAASGIVLAAGWAGGARAAPLILPLGCGVAVAGGF